MTIVYMFPGQSSRYPGMLRKLTGLLPQNRELLESASDLLHRDLDSLYAEDNPEVFETNRGVQVGVFLANHMFLQILEAAGLSADLSLGLSLGEYNHLVHIGALRFEDALTAVDRRGVAYDSGPRGAMASVFPIDLDELEEIVQQAAQGAVLEVVNLNSPTQHVLSGETPAIDRALALVEEETFARSVVIERRVPMHSSLFRSVGEGFRATLEGLEFSQPRLPYLPNRLGHIYSHPSREDFINLLTEHVYSPVLWRKSIDHVMELDSSAVFVEVGPKAVLHNLLRKKWHRCTRLHTDHGEEVEAHLVEAIDQLRAHQPRPQAPAPHPRPRTRTAAVAPRA